MKQCDLSFLVLGAGAIGGITGALLRENGYDVEIICKYADYAAIITEKGLNISGVCGAHNVRVPAWPDASGIKGKKDVILHATKATDMTGALAGAMHCLKDDGIVVSMQNGICEEELESVAGKGRVAGCVTGWGATMDERGKIIMSSEGDFIIGYPGRDPDGLLEQISGALSSIAPTRITNNITGHKYSKLIINSCITSLGAVCGLYLGEMLKIRKVRNIFIQIIREAVNVADKMNINIEVFAGRLDFRKFVKGNDILSDLKRHLMIRIIGFRYRKLKSSTLQSLERGKPAETDYLNGFIVKKGIEYGEDVSVNNRVLTIIHEIESGKRSITPDNFNEPIFDRFK